MTVKIHCKQEKRQLRDAFLLPTVHTYNEFEEEVYLVRLSEREIKRLHSLLNRDMREPTCREPKTIKGGD